MLPEFPLLYTYDQTGKILGISTRTVRRLAHRGEISTVSFAAQKGTHTHRVPRQSIIDFVTIPPTDTTDASDN